MEKIQIIVVEDESVVREYIKGTLQDLGYQVPAAVATGEDAITQAEKIQPDLLLMDIRLKGTIDGISAAEQIAARLHIPVVYLTSYADDSTLDRAKTTNPFGYIMKPFDEKELRATIEIAVYRARTEKENRERLFQELQKTTQKIFDLTHEPHNTGSANNLSQSTAPALKNEKSSPLVPTPRKEPDENKTLTLKDTAQYLGISDRTIQRMLKAGTFPEPSVTIELGGKRKLRRWKKVDLDAFRPHLRGKGRPKGT